MSISKAWDWEKGASAYWLRPSEDCYYVANNWKEAGYKKVLDYGCGLGRHAIYFAKQGFEVSAFDLSTEGTDHLKKWAEREKLSIQITNADMMELPYEDDSFDAIYAYHVISHTDTPGVKKVISEITRILKPEGEIFLTLCSKDSWSFKDAGFPKIDPNTVIKTNEGPEKDIPHFYVTMEDIFDLFSDYEIGNIRHIDSCYFEGKKQNSKHYYFSAKLK